MTTEEYVLGADDVELRRLELQNDLWRDAAHELWRRAGFESGQSVLDVGCGPGLATRELAQLVGPSGRILGIDNSVSYLDAARSHTPCDNSALIEYRHGDVQNLDTFGESFDDAFVRWVLCFVAEPEEVLSGVASALRTGGIVAIQDYYNWDARRLWPPCEAFEPFSEAVRMSAKITGGDLDIGSKLPTMLHRCGFDVSEMYPLVRIARPGMPLWSWFPSYVESFGRRLVEMNLLELEALVELQADLIRLADDPGAFFQTPPMMMIVARKTSGE